jgi:hypothetical protein
MGEGTGLVAVNPMIGGEDVLTSDLDDAQDACEWLNGAVDGIWGGTKEVSSNETSNGGTQSSKELHVLDSHLSKLSTALTITRQDTLATIDSTMSAVTSTVPRLGMELRLMRDAARTLKQNIEKLRAEADLASVEQLDVSMEGSKKVTAVAVLEKLAALSALHSRMTAAQNVLGLAESWSTLSTDVNAYLADAKYDVAAARLNKARSSLSVFERTPEFESRKKLLDRLAASIEAGLSPSLVDAIRDRDLGHAKRLLGVLLEIERGPQMFSIWRHTRSEDCLKEWKRITETKDEDGSAPRAAGSLPTLIRRFADRVISLLDEERKISVQVFPVIAPLESVSKLASLLLSSLSPTLAVQMTVWLSKGDSNEVLYAGEIHSAFRYMAVGINGVVRTCEGQHYGNSVPSQSAVQLSPESKTQSVSVPTSTPLPTHQRRMSARRSSIIVPAKVSSGEQVQVVSHDDKGVSTPSTSFERMSQWDKLLLIIPGSTEWEERLFTPLTEIQANYDNLERVHLAKEMALTSVELAKPNDETAHSLSQITHLLRLAHDAALRARKLTYGLASDQLVSLFDDNLAALISATKECFESQAATNLEALQRRKSVNYNEHGHTKTTAENASSYLQDSSETTGDGEEWRSFEAGMQLLSRLQNITELVSQTESIIAEQITDLADLLFTPISTSTTVGEVLHKLCTDSSGTCTASMRQLLIASAERLRSGSLLLVLRRIHAIASHKPTIRRGSVNYSSAPPTPISLSLFQSFRSALLNHVQSIHRHLTDMILSPLMPNLQNYATLPFWSASRLPGSVNDYDLNIPSFSLGPTEEMSRIGEALLDLPRLLEVWSDRGPFMWAVQGLAFAPDKVRTIYEESSIANEDGISDLFSVPQSSQSVSSPKRDKRMSMHTAASTAVSTTSPNAEKRAAMGNGNHRHTPSVASIATLPTRGEQGRAREEVLHSNPARHSEAMQTVTPQLALQSYLTSICLTLVSHLVSLVLPSISQITGPGASQLAADVEYLLTILSALNITPHTDGEDDEEESHKDEALLLIRSLEAWKDVCKLKDQDGRRLRHLVRTGQASRGTGLEGAAVAGFEGSEDRLRSLLSTQAFDMIARMRGW